MDNSNPSVSNSNSPYPERMQNAFDKIEKHRSNVLGLEKAARLVDKLEKDYPDIFWFASMTYEGYGTPCIECYVKVDTVKEVVPILQDWAKVGYRQTAEPKDNPDYGRRDYTMGNLSLILKFKAHIEEERIKVEKAIEESKETPEKQCRYVQRGVKEIPNMVLVCEGEEGYDDE